MDMPDFSKYLGVEATAPTTPTVSAKSPDFSGYLGVDPTPQDPWQSFLQKAVSLSKKRNFPPAVVAGQAALESGRGTSDFAKNRNNYFGYQAYDSNPDAAATFNSPEDSINAYLDLVQSYPGVSQAAQSGDPYATIQAIEANGYASDPNYVQKVTSTPEFQQYAGGAK